MRLKIITICLLGLFSATGIHAQPVSRGAYKSWQYFKPDVDAYLKYNWDPESVYNEQHSNLPLKAFFDTLELPVTVVEFKMISRYMVGAVIYVTPYDTIMGMPMDRRAHYGLTVKFKPDFIVAAPYEELFPILKSRDKTKVERIFVKWKPEYNKIVENLKYDYIIY